MKKMIPILKITPQTQIKRFGGDVKTIMNGKRQLIKEMLVEIALLVLDKKFRNKIIYYLKAPKYVKSGIIKKTAPTLKIILLDRAKKFGGFVKTVKRGGKQQ